MKRICKVLFFVFFFFAAAVFSQNYTEVDNKVRAYPKFADVSALGYRIMNDFDDDTERVRAAFSWITNNMIYQRTLDDIFQSSQKITFTSEAGREYQMRKLVLKRINHAFKKKKGVCIDYSLILYELCRQFGLKRKVILGIAKTDIGNIDQKDLYKNHSWNAVKIDGQWRLMDPTWASGYIDIKSNKFVRNFLDHYFFTEPAEFVKHHLPSKPEWQLLKEPISAKTFFNAPIFLPDYFKTGIALSSATSGILKSSKKSKNIIHFDELPRYHLMFYSINGSDELKKLNFKKVDKSAYISKIRLRRKLKKNTNYLTIFHKSKAILNFKIEQ